ncbi:hypothetical protein RFI_11139, partial [Reticulomyxa filosa]
MVSCSNVDHNPVDQISYKRWNNKIRLKRVFFTFFGDNYYIDKKIKDDSYGFTFVVDEITPIYRHAIMSSNQKKKKKTNSSSSSSSSSGNSDVVEVVLIVLVILLGVILMCCVMVACIYGVYWYSKITTLQEQLEKQQRIQTNSQNNNLPLSNKRVSVAGRIRGSSQFQQQTMEIMSAKPKVAYLSQNDKNAQLDIMNQQPRGGR